MVRFLPILLVLAATFVTGCGDPSDAERQEAQVDRILAKTDEVVKLQTKLKEVRNDPPSWICLWCDDEEDVEEALEEARDALDQLLRGREP
ncbi:MAG: hypothetical protein ABIK09_08335 [Pseudomonadota bacterium]